MLIDNPTGNFQFIKGIDPFSFGAIPHPGYEIVHVTFHPLPPLQKGFTLVERHLQSLQRPLQALCGMELRIPSPLSPQGFNEFNQPYINRLAGWHLLIDGLNPVARSNLAIVVNPVAEPSVYGFSYTMPSTRAGATFLVAGTPEVRARMGTAREIVARGDVSPAGLRQKAEYVLEALTARLQELQVSWAEATTVEIYTVHNLHPLLETTILPALQDTGRHGIRWHYARPPVVEVEYEMDVRGVHQELILPGES
jgi:hypothetical protein